ncbi:MAG TPA: type VI secretion system contractile sheath large subunit, partial [Nitrospiria bacterium]|nr:type VI secretion system contractile sheath large subunit [Nitrospiria bacterium]
TPSPGAPGRAALDKENLGEVMRQLAGSLSIKVPNRLGGAPRELSVSFPLDSIKAFHPDTISEALPSLRVLKEIRGKLVQLRDGKLSFDAFRTGLADLQGGLDIVGRIQAGLTSRKTRSSSQAPPSASSPGKTETTSVEKEKSLDSLLDMVAAPGAPGTVRGPSTTADALLDRMISLVTSTGASGTPIDAKLIDEIVVDLDRTLSGQMDEILHDPEFCRLEAVWRGVKFLLDRTDLREPIRIELLDVPKKRLGELFDLQVFQPESEGTSESPVSVVVAAYEFDRSRQDIELLQDLARKAEVLQLPFISSVGPAFLGLDSIGEIERLSAIGGIFDQPEYVKWRSLRKDGASRWLVLLFNRFLMRMAYGPEGERVKGFAYREEVRSDLDFLWGNPVWGMASLLTSSFARTGWCAEISGVRGGGVIEDLPVRRIGTKGGERGEVPLELLISEAHQSDLSKQGVIALACRLNTDAAWVISAPTAHLPERYPDAGETTASLIRSTLPFQMVAGRISHHVGRIAEEIGQGTSPEEVQAIFTAGLSAILADSGKVSPGAVEVKVGENDARPELLDISVLVRPDRAGLNLSAPVELNFSIRR